MSRKLLVVTLLALLGAAAFAQDWERIVADPSLIWGEGWGSSVEEADRQALSSLVSRITVAVVSDFRQEEQQVRSSKGDSHYSMQQNRTLAYSNVTLTNSHRVVMATGRKSHVGRWIHRDELEAIFADRKARVLSYEESAQGAESAAQLDDALRYHYWAYVLLRSLQRPSELRDESGQVLLNALPKRLNTVFDDLKVRMTGRQGDRVKLAFSFRGQPVRGLDFSYFDGAHWVPGTPVRAGSSLLEMAPGALAETIQLRIEYAYKGDSLMDAELHDTMNVQELKPLKKAFVSFRAKSN